MDKEFESLKVETSPPPKPGIKTSEFWMTVSFHASAILLMLLGLIQAEWGASAMAVVQAIYTFSRGQVKSLTPVMLVALLMLGALMTGCVGMDSGAGFQNRNAMPDGRVGQELANDANTQQGAREGNEGWSHVAQAAETITMLNVDKGTAGEVDPTVATADPDAKAGEYGHTSPGSSPAIWYTSEIERLTDQHTALVAAMNAAPDQQTLDTIKLQADGVKNTIAALTTQRRLVQTGSAAADTNIVFAPTFNGDVFLGQQGEAGTASERGGSGATITGTTTSSPGQTGSGGAGGDVDASGKNETNPKIADQINAGGGVGAEGGDPAPGGG